MADDPAIWARADQRLPLPAMMRQIGDEAFTKPKSACPFCGKKKGWGIYRQGGKYRFKCHALGCDGNVAPYGHGAVGYLALRRNLNDKEACVEYLRLALPEEMAEQERQRAERASRGGPAPAAAPPPPAANVWERLHRGLTLTLSDRSKLREKRGFSDETIDAQGMRSNGDANLPVLESLLEEYPVSLLVSEGIYKAGNTIRPTGQLHGWGRTGEKDKAGKDTFERNHPILIPYADTEGRVFYVRPHKGGVKPLKDDLESDRELSEDEEALFCAAHVYCPAGVGELVEHNDGLCVLTEGEFKAIANVQCGVPAIACPGISFIRNAAFRGELLRVLRALGVTDLVVCFDNEVKDDPKFKKAYKPDPWDRWDTEAYARYTAIDLREYFFSVEGSCRLGRLPNEERDPLTGKADFDGILAKHVAAHGLTEGTKRARFIFRQMVEAAATKPEPGLFPTEGERIIECKLQRWFHQPQIPKGGNREETLARYFAEVDPGTKQPVDAKLAEAFRKVRGRYYKRTPPKKGEDELKSQLEKIEEAIADLEVNKDRNKGAAATKELHLLRCRRKAIWERRKGLPEDISTFILICEYRLHTVDETVIRLVRVRDSKRQGPTPETLYRLTPENLETRRAFGKWGYGMGEAVWKGGDKETQLLVEDMDHNSFLRDIYEVPMYGPHSESGLWFFGDSAYAPDGAVILKDKRGIFWHDGFGYQIDDRTTTEGSCFLQGAPLLLTPQNGVAAREKPDVPAIFRQMADDMFDTIGDFGGWMAVGLLLSYAVAPETSVKGGTPGLFLYGPLSGGKTSIARWLAHIWGFGRLDGVSLGKNTTTVGMNRLLGQYHYLPVWFDEYRRHTIDDEKEAILRGAFDGGQGAKGTADPKRTRTAQAQTSPMVTGESSSRDSATRSRYGHVFVSLHKRLGDGSARFPRIQEDCKHYYNIGRWLMENRANYVASVVKILDGWTSDPEVRGKIGNDRLRFVYGVAYACFYVAAEMLEVFTEGPRLPDYRNALIEIGARGLAEVVEESFLNQFWRDILSGIERGAILRAYFKLCFRKVDEHGSLKESHADDPNSIRVCYFSPSAVFDSYQKDKAQRREEVPMSETDIRREMEKQPYFVPAPKAEPRCHRMRTEGGRSSCWVVSMEKEAHEGDTPEQAEARPFLYPFAEDLEAVLIPEKTA